ncbi:SGNH/GDSL hydrolase family protein [Paraconexibacter algicola]|nr:SGNH/GDSL hydrolase family protein [Paraconexibacter algicola]
MRLLALAGLLALSLLLAACGDDPGSAGAGPRPDPPAERRATTVVAALGDSITAGTPLWDPDPSVRAQIGPALDERSQWAYWYERDHPGTEVRNCGINGQRTDEIAQRLDGCARGADVLVVQGGINDIAQGRPVADAADDLDTMVRRGKAAGLRVAMVELLPWNNGYPAAAPLIDDLNRRIRAIGRREGVPVAPWYTALEDPAAPGRMRTDLTIEGDHPSVAGYRRLAARVRIP